MSNITPEDKIKLYLKQLGIEKDTSHLLKGEQEALIVKLAHALEDNKVPRAFKKDGALSTAYEFVEADPETYGAEMENIRWLMLMFLTQMKQKYHEHPESVASRVNYDIFQHAVLMLLRLQCILSIYEDALQAK